MKQNLAQFKLVSDFVLQGDQKAAVAQLIDGIHRGAKYQTLLGVTGSGKTYTMANVIEQIGKPTLLLSHNKTLAAQLYGELKQFFPENAVEYFISYYDYYQPEAYVPSSDTFIEKDMSINDEIEKLRLRATSSLLERRDVIIVASVSCIYGIGSPQDYKDLYVFVEKGQQIERNTILERLVAMQYNRNDMDFKRSTFRVRGDVIDVYPAYEDYFVRIEMFGNEIDQITYLEPVSNKVIRKPQTAVIFPATHFVTTEAKMHQGILRIQKELEERLALFRSQGKLLEAQRIEQRTKYDIEMMLELGYCSGIENYSRHIDGRGEGERPHCLMDYFPKDFLMIIDESHVTLPQVRAMYNGDRARKTTLVDYGFRLPSALDNRPLKFEEFEKMLSQVVFVSATPSAFELEKSEGVIIEQIIRPTGLLDPIIEVRPVKNQIDDLIHEIRECAAKSERVLVTTLTKRMAEDLTEYLSNLKIRVRYMHSEIDSLERVNILRDLRLHAFDVLVGINLLREGLDLPEVSLVAIIDADKEGFLRSERSLMQTAGRAARHVNGKVIFYADKITDSMKAVIDETNRRRELQIGHNVEHNITPTSISKTREEIMRATSVADYFLYNEEQEQNRLAAEKLPDYDAMLSGEDKKTLIQKLKAEMLDAVKKLEFERAANLRDQIARIES
ncbi:excinuclease ABC subunit UvrB [bacterium]|nr:MAG: excinuclease ABC subunit UvrB [bacterium]